MATTTPMKIRPETKAQIAALKIHPRETFDDVVTRLIDAEKQRQRSAKNGAAAAGVASPSA